MKRRIEPLVWLGFSSGGVAAAIFLPMLVFLCAFAFPLGWIDPPSQAHLLAVVGHPVTRVVLLGLFAMILLHAGHRFRYTLYDGLQIKARGRVAFACYGGAAVLALYALNVLSA